MEWIRKNAGIVLSVVYGLVFRIFFDDSSFFNSDNGWFGLYTISFAFIVPACMGIIPMLWAPEEKLRSIFYRFYIPFICVLLFFAAAFLTHLEELVCMLVIAAPYMVAAGAAGLLAGHLIRRRRKNRKLLSWVLLLPFFTSPAESFLQNFYSSYEVSADIIINRKPEDIWPQIVRVARIDDHEYKKGFFNRAGIPQPLEAVLDTAAAGGQRTGYFTGGWIFHETVVEANNGHKLRLRIDSLQWPLARRGFAYHVLKNKNLLIDEAVYTLHETTGGKTRLQLSCHYRYRGALRWYAAWWGRQLLGDFEARLLEVIKNRCDRVL
jgi:hypothetical protein